MRLIPLVILLLAAAGCGDANGSNTSRGPQFPPVYASYDPYPEPPAIMRDVALINDDVEFTQPFVPGHRTTMDGRVAIRIQGAPPGTRDLATNLSFYLFVPERLREPIMGGPSGAQILADPEPFDVPFPPALVPTVERLGHHAICDPTEEFAVEGERPNPYPCGPGEEHDCYDITIISTTSVREDATLWGTPATVEVADPKTVDARIVYVELGVSVQGITIPQSSEWTEPAVTIDGRLLTGRAGRFPRRWTNPNNSERFLRPYDLGYFMLPEDAEPCDVTGWTEFTPMSHAPFDPRLIGRYGLAAYPFRDTEGNLIPDGEDMGGTYPWVDREGANVFMSAVQGRLVEQSETRFPRRCVTPGCENYRENNDWDRGFLVAGLWTHGKFVHVDAMINNMDWAVGVTPATHFWVDLYRSSSSEPVPIRFGSGRFIDAVRNIGGPYPPGYTHNANILDSLQNLPNFAAAAQTVTPRDVVWIMSTGVATDEVAFDDFLDPDAFIVSNMQASITQLYYASGQSSSFPVYWNGQVRKLELPLPVAEAYVLQPEEDAEIHVQNAATTLRWNVPAYGFVEAGKGRIEPVALGGIQGKGFWLSGENEIRYTIPAQPHPLRETDWYIGMFLDPRAGEELRIIATFPDGSVLRMAGHRWVQYAVGDSVLHTIELPEGSGWVHLGLRLLDENRRVTLFHNGFAMDTYESDEPLFAMVEGDLVVGQASEDEHGLRGFRGWIDEFKVLAHAPNVEVACNHAHGTLVEVASHAELAAQAAQYLRSAHDEVASAAGLPAGGTFACYHDHGGDYVAHMGNIPAGTTSLRDVVNFPEGPLRAGAPRPDSSQNAFCLTCHRAEGFGGLTLAALEYDASTIAEHDRRRQPLQPPRRVFGNVPAGWIPAGAGPGSPDAALRAPAEGLLVDGWLLPGATE